MTECDAYRLVTNKDLETGTIPNFGLIAQGLASEAATLPVPESILADSFRSGMSAIVCQFNEEDCPQGLGHVRFTPLLSLSQRNALQLEGLPDIWEMGSGYINDQIRSLGLYAPLRDRLIREHIESITSGKVLILGTTKTPQVLSVLKKPLEAFGLEAFFCNHRTFPMISGLTCTCSGDHGQGYQFGPDSCSHRVTTARLPVGKIVSTTLNGGYKPAIMELQANAKMPCCLYMYGKPEKIQTLETILRHIHGDPANFTQKLIRMGYYR